MGGYYGTQYKVRLYPPFGYSILYKDIILLGSTAKKTLLVCKVWGLGLWKRPKDSEAYGVGLQSKSTTEALYVPVVSSKLLYELEYTTVENSSRILIDSDPVLHVAETVLPSGPAQF